MEYLKPDDIGKFNELVAKLTDVVIQMRIITKRMNIKTVDINILNLDDFETGKYNVSICSSSECTEDGTFTSFRAEINDGKQISVCSNERRIEI